MALAWQAAFELLVEGVRRPLGPVLDLLDGLDDPRAAARARLFLGSTLFAGTGMSDSERLVARALRECTELGDRWGVAAALSARATQAMLRGDLAALRRDGERSHALFEELGDQWGRLQAIDSLTTAAEIEGDYPRAGRLNSEGLGIAEELGLWTEVSQRLSGLGRIALLTGDHEAAERLHTQALRLATEQSSMPAVQFAEFGLALGARRQGRLDVAEAHARRVLVANQARLPRGGMTLQMYGERGVASRGPSGSPSVSGLAPLPSSAVPGAGPTSCPRPRRGRCSRPGYEQGIAGSFDVVTRPPCPGTRPGCPPSSRSAPPA
ncbi:tetratricopeptide repeat protein [Nonomuraea dietziae]|uniref:tetratricopeptide repeat protein n=1 Tax=Nonomuraea dietziae TaxID=65515 RepID=UPI0033E8E0C2